MVRYKAIQDIQCNTIQYYKTHTINPENSDALGQCDEKDDETGHVVVEKFENIDTTLKHKHDNRQYFWDHGIQNIRPGFLGDVMGMNTV